jgi:hypothetical protein
MQNYVSNRYCQCARCRLNGVMGPVILITLGVLILLGQTGMAEFNRTWPVILIVIGAIKILQSSASTEGHINRGALPGPPQPPASGPASQGPQDNSGQVQNV